MRRIDLVAIILEGWSRLDDRQRQRFAEMFLRAAVRLGGTELRRWLRRRVRTAPLAAPVDPARFAISDDMVALLKQLPVRADDAAGLAITLRAPSDCAHSSKASVPEISDWANDKRTIAGRKLGRGIEHFRTEGAKLIPPPTGDDPYEDEAYRLWALKQRGKTLV